MTAALLFLKAWWPEMLAAALIAGGVYAFHNYTSGIDAKGYARGVLETKTEYVNRDNEQLKLAIAAQAAAEKRANEAEAKAAAAQTLATTNYQKGVKDAEAKTAARLAAVGAGTLRLRDPGQNTTNCPSVNHPTGEAQIAGTPTRSDGQTGRELSGAASQFLLALTGEADQIARQLALAQDVIASDRQLCNSP